MQRTPFTKTKLLGRVRPIVEEEVAVMPMMKELETETTIARNQVLETCLPLLEDDAKSLELLKDFHLMYLNAAFSTVLPPQMAALDASQPWMIYWIANGLRLMDANSLTESLQQRIAAKILQGTQCGPFGGGYGQVPHLAGTYASICALALCENQDDCWDRIDRDAIYDWLMLLKQPNGGFKTCSSVGEVDTRGVYCALTVASMLNILTEELCDNVESFLIDCQNYEGGFGGSPQEDEAHGGYTYCAVASLAILKKLDKINIDRLMEWVALKQLDEEKGFCGRSNKLVDGCYSYWVGGVAAILETYGYGDYSMDKNALREYILKCCQDTKMPGLRDKPKKHPDFYHTNYCLLGLAITESSFSTSGADTFTISCLPNRAQSDLAKINPIYGLPIDDCKKFAQYMKK